MEDEQVPIPEVPVQEVPIQEVPAQEVPAQEVPAQEVPAQEAPVQQVPFQPVAVPRVPDPLWVEDDDEEMMVDGRNPADAELEALMAQAGALVGGRRDRVRAPNRHRQVRRRPKYTEAQKRRAVELLDMGLSCRTVAATLGPHCSSGTPIRWRKKFRAAETTRLGLAAVVREAGMNPVPLPNEIQIPAVPIDRAVAPPRRPGPVPRRVGDQHRRPQPVNRVRRL